MARPEGWLRFRREVSKRGQAMFWDRDLRREGYEAIARWWPWHVYAPGNRRGADGGADLVSILIPAHNAQDWLEVAVESALAQSWPEVEVLICDDGSTDWTRQAMMEFAGDARVRLLFSDAQRGLPATLNGLMRAARGSVFARLDADDFCGQDRIRWQVEYMRAAGLDACVCWGWAFAEDPEAAVRCEYVDETVRVDEEELNVRYGRGLGSCAIGPSLVWTRRLAEKVGWFDEGVPGGCDDHNYFLRMARVARIGVVQELAYGWRRHAGNMSRRGVDKPSAEWRRARAAARPYGGAVGGVVAPGAMEGRVMGGSPVCGASRGVKIDAGAGTGGDDGAFFV